MCARQEAHQFMPDKLPAGQQTIIIMGLKQKDLLGEKGQQHLNNG